MAANFILETAFVGQINIDFCDGFPNDFAGQLEKQLMVKYLGYELYAAIVETPLSEKYTELMGGIEWTDGANYVRYNEGMTSVLNHLFYYFYMKEQRSKQTPSGIVEDFQVDGQAYDSIGMTDKCNRAWNIALTNYGGVVDYINFKNSEITDYYLHFIPGNIDTVNAWGI